jgi:thiol-disulfide isomerase/thioredoxin
MEPLGGRMKLFKLSMATIAALIMLSAYPHAIRATELSSEANINTYPKPQQVADLMLKSSNGKTVSLRDFRGKVVLLHFWSIQCPACKIEEPLLDQLNKNFGRSGLEVLGVNLVDPPQAIAQHMLQKPSPFQILFNDGNGFSLQTVSLGGRNTSFVVNSGKEAILEIPGFPTTYVIDCRGSAVAYSVGVARWDAQPAVKFIQSLLADSKTCNLRGETTPKRYSMEMK